MAKRYNTRGASGVRARQEAELDAKEAARKEAEARIQKLVSWRRYLCTFVEEAMGISAVNGYKLWPHQKEYFRILGDLIYSKNMVANARELDGLDGDDVTTRYDALPKKVRQMAKKQGISIRSAKGQGKDFVAAITICIALSLLSDCKIPCMAPTKASLSSVLWSEIEKIHSLRSKKTGEYCFRDPFRSNITITAERAYNNEEEGGQRRWFAFPRTVAKSNDKEAMLNSLGGLHGRNMIAIMDEAAGIDDEIGLAIMSTLTSEMNIGLALFNPNKTTGWAARSHLDKLDTKNWITLHWDATKTGIVSPDLLEAMERKWGKDSDQYRVYVLGEFPRGDSDALIHREWVSEAIEREVYTPKQEDKVAGIDVGGGGSDPTIICVRRGQTVLGFERVFDPDPEDQAREIVKHLRKWDVDEIYVDSIGVGTYLIPLLRERFKCVHGIDAATTAHNQERFMRRRDELLWLVRERFQDKRISIPHIEELLEQLYCVKWEELLNGKIKVEGKKALRKRLGTSTDYLDALALSIYHADYTMEEVGETRVKDYDDEAWEESLMDHAWMDV